MGKNPQNHIFLRWIICILCSFSSAATLSAQGYYFYDNGHYEPSWVLDLSGNIGIMNGITDIQGNKNGDGGMGAFTLKSSKLTGGLTLTATHKDWVALRLDLGLGRVEGYDSLLKGATYYSAIGRYERNLNFGTNIFEFFVGAELHPVFLRDYQIYDRYMPRLSPYVTVGIGMTFFNPQALYNDQWVDVAPLRLEGQGFAEYPDREPYKKYATIIPLGIGLRYELSRTFTLRLEGLRRFTSTDYLDDVSQGDWVDPSLFYNYLAPDQADLAVQLYNRSTIVNPPRNTRPRGHTDRRDVYWSAAFRVGVSLNREEKKPKAYQSGVRRNSFFGRGLQLH